MAHPGGKLAISVYSDMSKVIIEILRIYLSYIC
jgi:hypothetical protein